MNQFPVNNRLLLGGIAVRAMGAVVDFGSLAPTQSPASTPQSNPGAQCGSIQCN
jgi:hypothetical protein